MNLLGRLIVVPGTKYTTEIRGGGMQLHIFRKGALYTVECQRCSSINFTHEWAHHDHNERRDAMEAGTLLCDECGHAVGNPETFGFMGRWYAGWYSMPGYLDCTSLSYNKNKRKLLADLREMYGDPQ